MNMKHFALVTAAGCLLALPASADADYPSRPIEVIIPFQPGDTDNMLRPFTEAMSEVLGQPMVISYRPGAGGGIGASEIANADPDGYKLVGTSPGSVVVVPLASPEAQYTLESFAPAVALSEGGFLLVVQDSSPYQTLQDLVDAAAQNPGEITFGTSGTMGITHLLTEAFGVAAGVELTHIPYQGSGPAITGLLGGHIDLATSAIAPAMGHISEGTLRPLAALTEERLNAYPDVPTTRELGFEIGSPALYGLLAPAGTSPDILERLHDAALTAIERNSDAIEGNLSTMGAQTHLMDPSEYGRYLQEQHEIFTVAVDAVNQ